MVTLEDRITRLEAAEELNTQQLSEILSLVNLILSKVEESRREAREMHEATIKEYREMKEATRKEYREMKEATRKEYREMKEATRKEYRGMKEATRKEYREIADSARQEYQEIADAARKGAREAREKNKAARSGMRKVVSAARPALTRGVANPDSPEKIHPGVVVKGKGRSFHWWNPFDVMDFISGNDWRFKWCFRILLLANAGIAVTIWVLLAIMMERLPG